MYKRGDKEFVLDMFISCKKILSYIKDMSYEDFKKDEKTVDAVIRNIEILGEAAKKISDEFKRKYPHVEWKEIAKTRDKLIHKYFGVDVEIIWTISKKDIPQLKEKLESILRKEGWMYELET